MVISVKELENMYDENKVLNISRKIDDKVLDRPNDFKFFFRRNGVGSDIYVDFVGLTKKEKGELIKRYQEAGWILELCSSTLDYCCGVSLKRGLVDCNKSETDIEEDVPKISYLDLGDLDKFILFKVDTSNLLKRKELVDKVFLETMETGRYPFFKESYIIERIDWLISNGWLFDSGYLGLGPNT